MTLFLDIETRCDKNLLPIYLETVKAPANLKDPEKIKQSIETKKAEAVKNLALDQDFSEIACIGIKEDTDHARIVTLTELIKLLTKHDTLVTFNGKNFDIPIIIKSCVKAKNPITKNLYPLIRKYHTDKHIDLMEVLAMNEQVKRLDTYLRIYLGISKTPIDFETCSQEELEAHCLSDVEQTFLLYNKFYI